MLKGCRPRLLKKIKLVIELSRQLTLAGRDVYEIRSLAENILQESSTWRLLAKIVQVQEEIEMIDAMEDDRKCSVKNKIN